MKNITLFIIGLLLLSCNQQKTQHKSDKQEAALNVSWSVKGCAEKAIRVDRKLPTSDDFLNAPPLDSSEVGIKAMGDSIVYNRLEEHLCCRYVKVMVDKKDNAITINENWAGKGCKCKCSSTVHAVVRELPKGEYKVYGVVSGTDPVEDKPTGIKDTVLTKLVTIQ